MIKYCKFCGEPFEPNSNKQIYCKRPHLRECPVCKQTYVENNVENLKRPPHACSYACRAELTKQTSLAKYGCRAPGNNPQARIKAAQTMISKYGCKYTLQSEELRSRVAETNLLRYGVSNVAKNEEIKEKRRITNRNKYGDKLPFNSPECYYKQHQTMLERYGVPYGTMTPEAQKSAGYISKLNLSWKSAIEQFGLECTTEHRVGTKQFDLFVPSQNLLIEINPSYTHNIIGNHWGPGLDKYYHRDKTELARHSGYKCINIWDWDNTDAILGIVKPKIDVCADQLSLYRLTPQVVNEFLKNNHYLGTRRGQLLAIGLVKDDELYQLMTFGPPTYDDKYNAQLYRMCTKIGYNIVGGYDTLSKFASELGLHNIISYCDLAKSAGSQYEDLGMHFLKKTPPRLIWSKGSDYISSSMLVKKHVSTDQLLTGGWLPVYDCGQAVYVFD